MALNNRIQEQLERIQAISENDIQALKTAQASASDIQTRLPMLLPLLSRMPKSRNSQSTFSFTFQWELYFYLETFGAGYEVVNQVNLHRYVATFYDAFLSRRLLQFNDNGLKFTTDSDIELAAGLDTPLRYPPRAQQGALFWGAHFRLSITSTNYVTQSI